MAFSVTNWNIEPNRVWYVRLADNGSNILVELYLTQADAEARTNLQASGSSSGFGADLAVTLANDPAATVPVTLFQTSYSWHIRVTGGDGDATKIFQVKEFVDLDEINHPIYRNEILIPFRAAAEIDAHTHAAIRRELELGSHLPELDAGDIVQVNSLRAGANQLGQVLEHRIAGDPNRLTSTIEVAGYLALKR
jgi:hypothetical protein